MSASSKKKIRKEQNAAMLTERQQKEQAEAKKIRSLTIVFSIIMVLIVAIFVISQVGGGVNRSGIIEKNTIVATVGEHKLDSVTMNYYFYDAVSNEYNTISNTYGDYADYFFSAMGLDLSKPLSEQVYDAETGESWADHFLSEAIESAKSDYALYDLAMAEGFELPEDSQSEIDTAMSYMQLYAAFSGTNNVKTYLRSMYGNGASEKSYEEYLTVSSIASAYYNAHQESLDYDDPAIRAYEAEDRYNNYSAYTFYTYYVDCEKYLTGGTTGEDGKTTYSAEEIEAARVAAEAAATTLATTNTPADFNAAIAALEAMNSTEEADTTEPEATESENVEDATEAEAAEDVTEPEAVEETTEPEAAEDATEPEATEESAEAEDADSEELYTVNEDVSHTDLSDDYAEWLSAEGLKEGAANVFPDTSTTTDDDGNETEEINGYYVLMFKSRNDRNELMDDVRHILFSFEGGTEDEDGNVTYSDEEKAAAKQKAEDLLKQWQEGDATEDSFIALVADNSDDTGSVDNGGLYEDIHPDSNYVENFLNWVIDADRKAGDTGIVETEYGYHLMYYVGNSELTYRDYLITQDMIADDMEEWYNGIVDPITVVEGNSSRINKDLIYSPAS